MTTWLHGAARIICDGASGNPSAKRFGLVLSVMVLAVVMCVFTGLIAGMVWRASPEQAPELVRTVSGSLEMLAGMVLTAVTTGYVGGKAIERRPSREGRNVSA